jgi:hypothetical protein
MDGRRGFAMQLLVDDALDQRLKGGLRAGQAQGKRACAFDEAAQFGICGGEFFAGERGVVTRRTRTVEWTRHTFTVSQASEKVSGAFRTGFSISD